MFYKQTVAKNFTICGKIWTRKNPNVDIFHTAYKKQVRSPKYLGIIPFIINRLHETLVYCKKTYQLKFRTTPAYNYL